MQRFIVLVGIVLLIAWAFYHFVGSIIPTSSPLLPVTITTLVVNSPPTPQQPQVNTKVVNNSLPLEDAINHALYGANGHYALAIKNLRTGESYFINEHEKFPSASLYKLWVMATVYDALKEGSLTTNTKIARNIADLNSEFHISDDYAEFTEGSINMTTKSALEQMIVISHNYAAMALTSKVSLASISGKMQQIGLNESKLGDPPVTTAFDVELFLEKLYRGKIADADQTKSMIELLSRQQKNLGIPKYLPEGIMVAHKTGEIDTYKHNGGIISTPNSDYILVVMSDSNFPEGAQERIALISKAVYDYFEAKQ